MRRDALTTFKDMGVLPPIADALERVGIIEAFPIQEMALPVALAGNDLIGQARTGTGKTYAFGVALLQRIAAPDDPDYAEAAVPGKPQALVVTPTRELTVQVSNDLMTASTVRRMRIQTIYGGRAYEPQVAALTKGVDVVVGTPGRLLDLIGQGHLDLSQVKVLVLDEADEMLDLGFLPDVEKIIAQTPDSRQTMLFSATMPAAIVGLSRRYMRQPLNIRAEAPDEGRTVPLTAQFVYRAHNLDKDEMIVKLLQAEGRGLTMIFSRTKRAAQRLADELRDRGFAAAAVHGDLGQGAREQALRAFRGGKVDVLVATDVAARGIDVEGVTHVVNLTCPEDEKTYLHRIGRTGRAGASGVAVTLIDWDDLARWRMINDALDLGRPDPAETYSSSEHFLTELGIPANAKSTLPRSARTRAGLDAETLEDLGETGKNHRARAKGSDARHGRGHARHSEPAVTSGTNRGERHEDETRPRRSRKRRRTRSGEPVELDPVAQVVTPEPAVVDNEAGEPAGTARRTRRRRSTPADSVSDGSTAQAAPAAAAAPASAAPAAAPASATAITFTAPSL